MYAKSIGIDYKRIGFIGDSAGASLAVSITLMAIKREFRVPDFLIPCYPTVS